MILNVVIIILETKFDCVIGTLQGKKKKVSSWDVISHTWPSYLVTLHPRGICWYLFVSPTRLLKYTHPSRRAVLMMPVSLPLSFCFLCVSWLSLSLSPCLYLSRRGARFLPVRPVKQHSWNSSTQQGSAVFQTRHVSSFDAKLFIPPMWYKVVVV